MYKFCKDIVQLYGVFFIYNKTNKGGVAMQDIGFALNSIMQDKQCSSIYAFFLLSEKKEGEEDGIHKLQSKPKKKVGRRLCHTSNF